MYMHKQLNISNSIIRITGTCIYTTGKPVMHLYMYISLNWSKKKRCNRYSKNIIKLNPYEEIIFQRFGKNPFKFIFLEAHTVTRD